MKWRKKGLKSFLSLLSPVSFIFKVPFYVVDVLFFEIHFIIMDSEISGKFSASLCSVFLSSLQLGDNEWKKSTEDARNFILQSTAVYEAEKIIECLENFTHTHDALAFESYIIIKKCSEIFFHLRNEFFYNFQQFHSWWELRDERENSSILQCLVRVEKV